MDNLGEKIKKLSEDVNSDMLENASDEELLDYLFLVEKLKIKLQRLIDLDNK